MVMAIVRPSPTKSLKICVVCCSAINSVKYQKHEKHTEQCKVSKITFIHNKKRPFSIICSLVLPDV